MSAVTVPRAVEDFVAATNAHDGEALFAVFAPGATVVDDGNTSATPDELREWIRVHQVEPRIVMVPASFDDGRLVASVDGDFAGGPLVFAFDFVLKGDPVAALQIAPA